MKSITVYLCVNFGLSLDEENFVPIQPIFNQFNDLHQIAMILYFYYTYIIALKVKPFKPFHTAITSALVYRLAFKVYDSYFVTKAKNT